MRDNMLKIPEIPSNSDEGDLYENIETRPGTTDKQKEAGRCAYTELFEAHARWAGGTLLGCDFPKDFREKGGTTFLNQPINPDCRVQSIWKRLDMPIMIWVFW